MEAAVDKALTSADFPRAPAPAAVAPAAEVRAAPAAAAAVKEPEKKVSPVVTRCATLDALHKATYPITYTAETVVLCHQGCHACALTCVQLLHGHMWRSLCNLQGRRPSPSEMRSLQIHGRGFGFGQRRTCQGGRPGKVKMGHGCRGGCSHWRGALHLQRHLPCRQRQRSAAQGVCSGVPGGTPLVSPCVQCQHASCCL